MTKHNDGGPAFPRRDYDAPGMTLRDYFAAQAMAAIISKLPLKGWLVGDTGVEHEPVPLSATPRIQSAIAVGAYGYADAMLNAREVWK
jgi:hypothetical protein